MKIPLHNGCWIIGRALGAALIVLVSSFVLPAQAVAYYADSAVGDNPVLEWGK